MSDTKKRKKSLAKTQENTAKTNRWGKGQSGNPSGRPAGDQCPGPDAGDPVAHPAHCLRNRGGEGLSRGQEFHASEPRTSLCLVHGRHRTRLHGALLRWNFAGRDGSNRR